MSRAHRIDEFIFDCSFDSLSLANEHEPEMNAFLTVKLLPAIDSILDEFDETGAVWRLDRVEIDLGDIPGVDFYAELVQRVQEELSDQLRALQSNLAQSGSMPVKTLPAQLPVQRLSTIQTDLEKLQDFLLTGRMPWYMDTADRHAHEKMLQQILREHSASAAWVHLLKRLPSAERTVVINRLVSQFPHRALEDVLSRITPDHAHPLLDFLRLYQRAISDMDAMPAAQTQAVNAVWEKLLAMLLQHGQAADNGVTVLDRLFREIAPLQARESLSLLKRIRQFAVQSRNEGKTGNLLYDALLAMENAYARNLHTDSTENSVLPARRNDHQDAVRDKIKGTENGRRQEEVQHSQSTAQPTEAEQTQPIHEALYSRIIAALQQAKLIDAEFASSVLRLQAAERRQRLQRLLQSPQIKPQLLQLPQSVLLDIGYWLSPPAALLIERLLAHSAVLHRLPGSSPKITQKHWKQQLWGASLDYLLSGTATEIDPAVYLQTLVRAVSPEEADLQTVLRAWYAALEHSETGGAMATLLRTLIGGAPAWQRAVEETLHFAQELNPESEASAPYRQLQQRFATGQPTAGQYSLRTLLETLATGYPAQLRQLYQDLRSRRYDVTAAQLDAIELHSLVEHLLRMESASDTADRRTFLQAIEKHADQVSDRQAYYRLLLEELLHDREIDLEAIAIQSQQTPSRFSDTPVDWNKQDKQDKQTETESATGFTAQQSTKQPFPAGDETLYATVIAALREAQLIDAHHVTVETDDQPAELRQRLRMTLRTIAVPGWVDKLPQSIRMNIAYLLAPQAAVLNEHLLAQTDKLYRVTGQNNRQQWQQRLWAASLRYLLTLDTAEITPAIYLQALARGVSDETGVQITLRAWYEALAQGEADDKTQTADFQHLPENRVEERKIDPKAIAALQQQTLPENDPTHKNQDKPITAEPVSTGPTFQPMAPQSRTGFETLYVTVMAELRRIGLIHERLAVMEEGIQPANLRQRLLTALRAIAVHDWVNQLTQSARMDIAYLLAPPAAVLNEHLLAHADTLYRAAAWIEQSSRKQWEQRLWTASLRYLLTLNTAEITPAAYLHALACDVSGETDAQITLQAWHEALAQRNTSGVLHTLLRDLTVSTQAKGQTDTVHREPAKPQAARETENIEETRLPQITAQLAEAKRSQPVHEELYSRILVALQQVKLIDAGFASSVLRLQMVERQQRLQRLLQSSQIKPRLLELPQPVLLDISYWLSLPAALLFERLLAHSTVLYRLPGSPQKTMQKHWKQRLWGASLDYLLSGTGTEIDPSAYLQALVRAVSPEETDLHTTLRAWYAALEHSETGGAIATLLRTLIGGAPARQRTVEEIPHSVQTLNPESEANAVYRQLQQRFATNYPAQLDAFELHSLIEQLLHLESAGDTTDRLTFLQAIEQHADRVSNQQAYYRLLLEELLHDREIDLEAIAIQSQQAPSRLSNTGEDWNEQAKQAKQAEAESATGSASQQSTKQHSRPGDETLYATVLAALYEAQLIDAHRAAIETSIQPAERRQRLRSILRTIAVPDWVDKLPQSIRMDIAYLLAPQAAVLNEHLLAQADKLYRVSGQENRQQWQQRLWAASLRYLLTLDAAEITPAAYLQALAHGVSDETDAQISLRAWYEALTGNKTAAAIRLLLQAVIEPPAESLHTGMENPLTETGVNPSLPVEQAVAIDWDALLNRTESTGVTEEIYIDNAGQVLAAPYLPRLFSMLKLAEEGAFADRQAAERAVHLLQFMVNEQTQSPEYQLTLNKILCGVSTGIPICREIAISAQEQETIEGLIRGMIQNWKTIGNTSISGLRETFLRRKGKLQLKEDGMWYLTVEPGVFDMLLDSLPWSFSVIKHSWMERAVHVTWR
ncbi:contractile injection system tape measure protein [Nitrosomonas sp. Is35]|uniref:contractile injection system tape measure protein n=1 Tax=Nitrosomonas sp. Is35 TaxID=3080534 RepID=UPI00294B4E3D|nr:contractile injection system tape measure protein [Nitrosomonas sp. Is35]MDV6348238.1 contractile injection system tape measure protein [Nitrosomonas sp. Is35]